MTIAINPQSNEKLNWELSSFIIISVPTGKVWRAVHIVIWPYQRNLRQNLHKREKGLDALQLKFKHVRFIPCPGVILFLNNHYSTKWQEQCDHYTLLYKCSAYCDLKQQWELLKAKAFQGSRMNPIITIQAWKRKGQANESEHNWQTWRAWRNPQEIECCDHLFIWPHYRKISHSADLWADVGLSSLMIKGSRWSEDLERWMLLKVKSNFSAILSRSLLLCFDTDWLVCLVSVFWGENGEREKCAATAKRQQQSSPQAYDLLLCCVSFWINLTWDCMVHKQTQNNFQTKLPASVGEEMEGKSEYLRVPSIHKSSPSLKFESLSSGFQVVCDTVNMKRHLIMMNE